MKRSSVVVLVVSGALLAGCNSYDDNSWEDSQTYTNNHYVAGRGYYHAPYRSWYPFPYNYYDAERRSYYHGGNYTTDPHVSAITASQPSAQKTATSSSHVRRSGFTSSRSISS